MQGSLVDPTTPKCKHLGLGSSPVARRYWGNHVCFLFLRVLRCFSSPRYLSLRSDGSLHPPGCPIRKPVDHSLLAAPYGISSLGTSFVGALPQGIHQRPCVALDTSSPISMATERTLLSRFEFLFREHLCTVAVLPASLPLALEDRSRRSFRLHFGMKKLEAHLPAAASIHWDYTNTQFTTNSQTGDNDV